LNNPDNDIYESGIWYAPTCGSDTFKCEKCGKLNFITAGFTAIKIKEVTFEKVKEGFLNATMGTLTDEQIERHCKEHLKQIKK